MTPTTSSSSYPRLMLPLRFVGGVIFTLLAALLLFVLIMRPPMNDIEAMVAFLSITSFVSLAVGYGVYKAGWAQQSPRLVWSLVGQSGLASLLTFINVWLTARLMFVNDHDFQLATILLVFAGGIAIALGYFLSTTLTERISLLNHAATDIAAGKLSTRLVVQGRDEVAQLSHTFNQMATQLEAMAQQQAETDKMRRDLIAWVGHDLRTPLASIRAILEALGDGMVEDPDTATRYIQTAQRDIRSLSALIEDLFEMAKLDAGGFTLDKVTLPISDLISDTMESFSELARQRGVTLTGSVAPHTGVVHADVQKLGRVLANLISNALRYTPEGGTVSVTAKAVGTTVQVEVSDTGAGIPANDLPRVFEQFYRGDKARSRAAGGGAGLGLAISKRIVEAHGGTITVDSKVGEGTTFRFTIGQEEAVRGKG
jgi:two-component system sensor histidine kinase BaeS